MRALTLLLALVLPSLQQSHKGVRQVGCVGSIVHILPVLVNGEKKKSLILHIRCCALARNCYKRNKVRTYRLKIE